MRFPMLVMVATLALAASAPLNQLVAQTEEPPTAFTNSHQPPANHSKLTVENNTNNDEFTIEAVLVDKTCNGDFEPLPDDEWSTTPGGADTEHVICFADDPPFDGTKKFKVKYSWITSEKPPAELDSKP